MATDANLSWHDLEWFHCPSAEEGNANSGKKPPSLSLFKHLVQRVFTKNTYSELVSEKQQIPVAKNGTR